MHGPAPYATVQVLPPGLAATVYEAGAGPLAKAGVTETDVVLATATVGAGGVLGGASGVTVADEDEDEEVPAPLVAEEVKV